MKKWFKSRKKDQQLNEESRLAKIVENATAGYFFIDKDGIFQKVNAAWIRMYKYESQEEIIGHHFVEIQKIEDLDSAKHFGSEIMNNNPAYLTGETSRKCKDGSIGYHSFSANPVVINSQVVGIEGFIIDTTQRKLSEERLSLYEEIVSSTTDFMSILDINYTYLAVNKAYCLAFDHPAEYFAGKSTSDIFGENNFQQSIKPNADRCMKGEIVNFKNWLDFPTHEKRYMDINFYPHYDKAGNAIGFVVNGRDITEQMLIENALKESEIKYRALFDNAPLAYQSLDETGHFIDVNPSWLSMLGYERNEVIGQKYADFLHPDWKPVFEKKFPEFKRIGHVNNAQFKIRKKDGNYLDISFEGCIGYYPDGSFRQTYCVFHDITDQLRAERELKENKEKLEDIIKERTQKLEGQKADLIAMNKAFIGREFRIKELRDEIKALKEGI
ncbi:MAG: PAS domain S-box protein [Candidatus Stygibacter australis]|nr:PAS domain S-box protein [Candidatus Stygibacter australis]